MKWKDLQGRIKSKSMLKYTINWDKESKSAMQKTVKDFLRPYWESSVCFEEMPCVGTRLSLDIVNASRKVAVEVQGQQHEKHIPYFHGESKLAYVDQIVRDADKAQWCEVNDLILVEIYARHIPTLSVEWFEESYGVVL